MRVFEYTLLSAGDMSQATVTSNSQQLVQMAVASIQAVFTGSPVGTLKLQISNDNSNWTDYTNSSVSVTTSGNFLWNLVSVGFQYVRVVYTKSSGTGSLTVTVSGKGV